MVSQYKPVTHRVIMVSHLQFVTHCAIVVSHLWSKTHVLHCNCCAAVAVYYSHANDSHVMSSHDCTLTGLARFRDWRGGGTGFRVGHMKSMSFLAVPSPEDST